MDELDSEDSDNDLVISETANLLADTADESDSGESDSSDYGDLN